MSDVSRVPRLTLLLPGRWLQAPLHDDVRVEGVLQRVTGAAAAEELRLLLREVTAAGGDQLLVSATGGSPSVVLTAWSDGAAALGDGAVTLERGDDGFTTHRVEQTGRTAFVATYVVRRLDSGRVLTLTVCVLGDAEVDEERRTYDLIATRTAWSEDDLVPRGA